MPRITLADIRSAADAKYGPLVIDLGHGAGEVTLLNVLRLPDQQKHQFRSAQRALEATQDDTDADLGAALRDALRAVAATRVDADRLLAALGDDDALLVSVFESYAEGTQAPEAPRSPS